MANLKEQEKWEDGIYQIEENDPVLGGEEGVTNRPAKQLANRTAWLKKALSLLGLKAQPKTLTATSTNKVDEDGHSHAIDKASLTQQGIVQLTNALNSDAENLALTAKAGKALAQQIVQAKQEIERDYIPNTKKSAAVNSTSTDTVATSAAVKTAYDKGVEAKNAADSAQRTANEGVSKATTAQTTANSAVTKADNAQRAADNANNNANNRVSKAGDTMTGNLIIDSSNAAWSALLLRNRQNKYLVYEVNPDTESNAFGSMIYRGTDGDNIFKLQLPKRNGEIAVKEDVNSAQRTAESANNNANNRVSKSGDTMTGNLVVKNGSPWSSVVLDNNQGQGIKLESRPNDDGFMGEISHLDIHNGYRNINTLLLPKKSGTLALEADVNGKAPLSDFDRVKNNYYDKSGFAERSYPSHYHGAHVWTMRFNQFGGLRIIQLRAEIKNSLGTVPIYLPEEMTTQSLSIATDDGHVKYSYGSKVTSNNIVTVYTPQNKTVGINLFVIGWVNF